MNPTYRLASVLIERARKRRTEASGPFKGATATFSASLHDWNKLMGAYESYLHDLIEDALACDPPLCINVGAAEGCYTLGLARRLPLSRHLAYEMMDESRQKIESLTFGVNASIETRGECSVKSLKAVINGSERGFLIMDCEGWEDHLLTNALRSALSSWHILVEVHDISSPRGR
jgi:hypothetical protein